MTQPSKKKSKGRRITGGNAQSLTLPAPVGGMNTRDSLAAMPEDDAVTLKNWWPTTTYVTVRNGYTPWTSSPSVSGYIESLMVYSGSTTSKMFAASSNGSIYNVTQQDTFLTNEAGAYVLSESGSLIVTESSSITTDVTGLTNGRWQDANMTTSAGSYLRIVNGADKSRVYDGTNWHTDGDGAPYDITGVDSATLVHINLHKNRLWFVQNGTLKAWYLPTSALGGAAVVFDLSAIAQKGGYLVAMATWTIDAGYGVDDLAIWMTSNGEVIVYRGTDPSSATTWALVGVWAIGAPVGRRCMFKWAGDLLIITRDGVMPMSAAMKGARTDPRAAITYKIQSAISNAVSSYGANFGWQLIYFAEANQLYVNVPAVERTSQQQYVMNTITKAWAQFTGWAAGCWAVFNNRLYFGGYNLVGQAWNSNADADGAISTTALQAFNYLGSPGRQKRMTMFQPILYTTGSPSVSGGVNVDFDTTENTAAVVVQPSLYALWDTATWDTSLWGPDLDLRKLWNGAKGVGNAFAPVLNTSSNGIQLQWVNSTLVYEEGAFV